MTKTLAALLVATFGLSGLRAQERLVVPALPVLPKPAATDDDHRKQTIGHAAALHDALNRFQQRIEAGVFKHTAEMPPYLDAQRRLLNDHLALETTPAGKRKVLESFAAYARWFYGTTEGRCKVDNVAIFYLGAAYKLETEVRLAEFRKANENKPPEGWEKVEDADFVAFLPKVGHVLKKAEAKLPDMNDFPELGEVRAVKKDVSDTLDINAYILSIRPESLAEVNKGPKRAVAKWSDLFLIKVPADSVEVTDFSNDEFGYKGKQYVYEDQRGPKFFYRMFVAHEKFYVINVVGVGLTSRSETVRNYFDSFQPIRVAAPGKEKAAPPPEPAGPLKPAAGDDALRKLKVEHANALIDASNRFRERIEGGVFKASEEQAAFLDTQRRVVDAWLELEATPAGKQKVLETFVADAEKYYSKIDWKRDVDNPAMLHLALAHKLDLEMRLAAFKKAAK